MHVALIYFCPERDGKSIAILERLKQASESRGNRVDAINGYEGIGNLSLTIFDYIAVVMKSPGMLSAKVPPAVGKFLAESGNIGGKKGCAIVIKAGPLSEKSCANLMNAMEGQGVKLDYFEVVRNADHAASAGKKIG